MSVTVVCKVCGEVGWKHNYVPIGGGTVSGGADGHVYQPVINEGNE